MLKRTRLDSGKCTVEMPDHSYDLPLPEPIITILEDGCVSVTVGCLSGVISSMHLIEPKVHQLQKAWLEREQQKQSV